MIPGMDPRAMKAAMKKMGLKQEDLDAQAVIIHLADRTLVFDDPAVQRVEMMGETNFQISGTYREETLSPVAQISDDDIDTVIAQTGCSKEQALAALQESGGDIAEAIMSLT